MNALVQALQEMQESAERARSAQAEEEAAFRRYCDASVEEKHGPLGDEYIARARRTEDRQGFLVRQWRADIPPGWPTDPTPSDAFRILEREWIPEGEALLVSGGKAVKP